MKRVNVRIRPRLLIVALVVGWAAAGCASTAGGINPISPVADGARLANFENLSLEVGAGTGVSLTATDKERIARLIVDTIRKQGPTRFKEINSPDAPSPTLRAAVTITRYEKGNAFARFMLAGLGQIHINAEVVLQEHGAQDTLGRYEVSKTFAWGGIYGAATRIDDVEEGFANAVAAVLLGKDER